MTRFLTTAAITALIAGSASAATIVPTIGQLEMHDDNRVTVSGVVSWVEDSNEFTIADRTGDIEVNLTTLRPGIDAGDYVTVTGEMDDDFMDDAIEEATVTILSDDYDVWYTDFEAEYELRYDRNGMDSVFYETVDWDNDLYDDYYYVRTD